MEVTALSSPSLLVESSDAMGSVGSRLRHTPALLQAEYWPTVMGAGVISKLWSESDCRTLPVLKPTVTDAELTPILSIAGPVGLLAGFSPLQLIARASSEPSPTRKPTALSS
jgi:hypothetical protein